jgi:hypothetical protein
MFRKRINESLGYLGTNRKTRRGAKLGIVVAILLALPGLVAGVSYVATSGSHTLATTVTGITALNCGFYGPINDTSATPYDGFSGTNGSSMTATFGVVDGSTYEYLIDEAAVGCVNIPANSNIGLLVTESAVTAAASGTIYQDLYVSGGNTAGIGQWNAGTLACSSVTAAPCSNYPDAPYCNPTVATSSGQCSHAVTACESHTTASNGALFRPYGATNTNTWAYNDTSSAWMTSGCGASAGAPPQINIDMTSPTAGDIYFFYVVSFAAFGLPSAPAGGVTLTVAFCNGGSTTCTA